MGRKPAKVCGALVSLLMVWPRSAERQITSTIMYARAWNEDVPTAFLSGAFHHRHSCAVRGPSSLSCRCAAFCDLNFGTSFFSASNYGQPLLWQHLFTVLRSPRSLYHDSAIREWFPKLWLSIPKPIFGYKAIVYAMVAIGVWVSSSGVTTCLSWDEYSALPLSRFRRW
jgi:hypothetical protein